MSATGLAEVGELDRALSVDRYRSPGPPLTPSPSVTSH